MAFKLLKTATILVIGMMLAPKKGNELRQDFIELLQKNNSKLRGLVKTLEVTWETSQGIESDEISADIELRIKNVRAAVESLEGSSTKELAYKALKKLDSEAKSLMRAAAHSPNVQAVAREIATAIVSIIDSGLKATKTIKEGSTAMVDKLVEESQERLSSKTKKLSSHDKDDEDDDDEDSDSGEHKGSSKQNKKESLIDKAITVTENVLDKVIEAGEKAKDKLEAEKEERRDSQDSDDDDDGNRDNSKNNQSSTIRSSSSKSSQSKSTNYSSNDGKTSGNKQTTNKTSTNENKGSSWGTYSSSSSTSSNNINNSQTKPSTSYASSTKTNETKTSSTSNSNQNYNKNK